MSLDRLHLVKFGEAARLVGGTYTLQRLIETGKITPVKLLSQRLFRLGDLLELQDAHDGRMDGPLMTREQHKALFLASANR